MGNRFGFKDGLLLLAVVATLVSVWLSMVQYDRQYELLEATQRATQEQTRVLQAMSDRLASGVVAVPRGGGDGGTEGSAETLANPWAGTGLERQMRPRLEADFASGDWVVLSNVNPIPKLTPFVTNSANASYVQGLVLEPLATRDPNTLDYVGVLARSWDVSEDGLTIRFELRDDVVFSDGEPMTSADVVFTYNLVRDPELANPWGKSYWEKVESIEADGDYAVVFRLKEYYFLAFGVCASLQVLPEHFYSQFTIEEINQLPGLLVGTGPLKLPDDVEPEAWQSGDQWEDLVRNENYWGPQPGPEKLRIRFISGDVGRLQAFRNGEVDLHRVPPEEYETLRSDAELRARAELYEYETVNTGYRYLGWNQRRGEEPTPFADRRVRRAMTMLIDRQRIIDRVMRGLATIDTGPFHRDNPQADPDVVPIAQDVEGAKALLREAGYFDRDGDPTTIEKPDGTPFRFTLMYPSGTANYESMAKVVQDDLARAGIRMIRDATKFETMIQKINARDFDAIALGWTRGIEGDLYQIFHSSQVGDGGSNATSYTNPELDRVIETARITVDPDERQALWRQAHRIIHEDQPYTFLFTQKTIQFVANRFRNVEVTETGLNSRLEWYVPRSLQTYTAN
ncbi:MAG: ABC transporter substrate-binding protein [Planctomycetota bacterium]